MKNYWPQKFVDVLNFIRNEALDMRIIDNEFNMKTELTGGTGVNAYEILAKEFEAYWRHVIENEK